MPCAWERNSLENVMAVSACSPAIRKDHQHMLFDLSRTERFQCFSVFLQQNPLDQLQGEKRGLISICEAWISRMNSPYKHYPVNCRRDLERFPGWLLTFPSFSLAISAIPSHFPVRTITVRYKMPLFACPHSCRTRSEYRRQIMRSANKQLSQETCSRFADFMVRAMFMELSCWNGFFFVGNKCPAVTPQFSVPAVR